MQNLLVLVHEDLADVTKLLSEHHLGYARTNLRHISGPPFGKYFAIVHFNRNKYLRSFYVHFSDIFLINNPYLFFCALISGKGGVGKTTAMKQLGLSWVDGTVNELNKFDFVFHVDLKDIKKKAKLEEIIVDQHKGLNCNGVHPAEVKEILQGKRVLLLFDGYDEYHDGTNADIDKAIIKSYLRNCWIITTSRETTQLSKIRRIHGC